MAYGTRSQMSYSEVVKKTLKNQEEVPSIEKQGQILLDHINNLRKTIPTGQNDLKDKLDEIKGKLDDIAKTVDNLLYRSNEDRKTKDKKIRDLEMQVSDLKWQVSDLKCQVYDLKWHVEKYKNIAGTIDAGEAMKLMETHVAAFILPRGKTIAKASAMQQMLEHVKSLEQPTAWSFLQTSCGMTWTPEHTYAKDSLIRYRNYDAHHKKFDIAQLREIAKENLPHRAEQCDDIINLFEKVNILLKLGVIASEPVLRKIITKKYSKHHLYLLNLIRDKFHRDVQHLQDTDITEARKHLLQYIPEHAITLWDEMMDEIKNTNRLRLAKLVKDKEAQVVRKIFKDQRAVFTFEEMNSSLIKGKIQKRKRSYVVNQWNRLTDGKEWTSNHSMAMETLKRLLPANYPNEVQDLPLKIAQLHIPDFLEKNLWTAGSDIMEIFIKSEE